MSLEEQVGKIINARYGLEPYFKEHPELMKILELIRADAERQKAERQKLAEKAWKAWNMPIGSIADKNAILQEIWAELQEGSK